MTCKQANWFKIAFLHAGGRYIKQRSDICENCVFHISLRKKNALTGALLPAFHFYFRVLAVICLCSGYNGAHHLE